MIRVISSRRVEGDFSLTPIGACVNGVVSALPPCKVCMDTLRGLVCLGSSEGLGINVKGLDDERHVV